MALVTAAITAERLAPRGARVARATGVVAIACGLLALARVHPIGLTRATGLRYSARIASAGSTFAARNAGTDDATSATPARTSVTRM